MSAAGTAGGYLGMHGMLKPNDLDVRHEATKRRVELQEREHGKVCPHCSERFHVNHFEFHLFIAHKLTEAKS